MGVKRFELPDGAMQIKNEHHRLHSRYRDQSLMYPGEMIFTWIKLPFLPWTLVSIEPSEAA